MAQQGKREEFITSKGSGRFAPLLWALSVKIEIEMDVRDQLPKEFKESRLRVIYIEEKSSSIDPERNEI